MDFPLRRFLVVLTLVTLPLHAQNSSLDLPYKTEQEWIIMSVCRDIYELVSVAADGKGDRVPFTAISLKQISTDPLSYDVTLKGSHGTVETVLKWDGSIWSSQAYLPFAQAAAHTLNFIPPSPPVDTVQGNPLHTLLDYSDKTVKREADRVSAWLSAEPTDPRGHEQAACIVGTFAMKENSGYFFSCEGACNQVAAHLAMARLLEPTLHAEGMLAECQVGLIIDTTAECTRELAELSALPNAKADLMPWINASRVRNTRDWTTMPEPDTATPMEQMEYFRALAECAGTDQALIWWAKNASSRERIDWSRLVTQLPFSVEVGHVFAMSAVDNELANMQSLFPGRYSSTSQVTDLNQLPGDLITLEGHIRVLSDGMWAQYFQRHLLMAYSRKHYFLFTMWGVPDEGKQFDDDFARNYNSLLLYPFARVEMEEDSEGASDIFQLHPELGYCWLTSSKPALPAGLVENWYSPSIPNGTAYVSLLRMDSLKDKEDTGPAEVDRLFQISPDHYGVALLKFTKDHPQPTYAQFNQELGKFTAFDPDAVYEAEKCSDITIDQKLALYEKAAQLQPGWYYNAATTYLGNNLPDKAAEAYRKWYYTEPDRVEISNSMEWLVRYDYDHGKRDEALKIAKEGAEVYSSAGLTTLLLLDEKMGDLKGAKELAEDIEQRYQDKRPYNDLLYRHPELNGTTAPPSAPSPTTPPETSASSGPIAGFPHGLQNVSLDALNSGGAPATGVQFGGDTAAMKTGGLTSSMVIVALDGIKVENTEQYAYVARRTEQPEMRFIVWINDKYIEMSVTQPGRKFGVSLLNYTAQ